MGIKGSFTFISFPWQSKSVRYKRYSDYNYAAMMLDRTREQKKKKKKDQLIDRVRKSGRFSLQLDECTDVSGDAQLLAFVRYSYEGNMYEDMLFCSSMEGTCTGRNIFNKLNSNIQKEGLRWESCVSVCTDGAGAMQGKGLRACVLEVAPHVKFLFFFCFIFLLRQDDIQERHSHAEENNVHLTTRITTKTNIIVSKQQNQKFVYLNTENQKETGCVF